MRWTKKNKRSVLILLIFLLTSYGLAAMLAGCASKGKDVYYCPMHPTYTSDRPGDCPICNMKLVKKEAAKTAPGKIEENKSHAAHMPTQGAGGRAEDKAPDEICIEHACTMNDCPMTVRATIKPGERVSCPVCGEYISTANGKIVEIAKPSSKPTGPMVMVSEEKQQIIGLTTGPVARRNLKKTIKASGRIAYDPELAITQEEFIQAVSNEEKLKDSPLQDVIDRANSLTEAARRKLLLLGMSDEQIERLKETRKAETSLYLPGKGENVWAYVSIYEYEIGLVKPGLLVEIESVAYPGEIFHGTVASLNPVLDPVTRTNRMRVEVANPDGKLKPEMFVNAKISAALGEKLAVPDSAVLDTGVRKIVYLSREGDMLESREVTLGQRAGGYYEVIEGLEEGDVVVTSGNFLIDSESRLKSAAAGEAGHKQHGQ